MSTIDWQLLTFVQKFLLFLVFILIDYLFNLAHNSWTIWRRCNPVDVYSWCSDREISWQFGLFFHTRKHLHPGKWWHQWIRAQFHHWGKWDKNKLWTIWHLLRPFQVLAVVRAHITALSGNAMVSFYMSELILVDNPHKNQVNQLKRSLMFQIVISQFPFIFRDKHWSASAATWFLCHIFLMNNFY